MRSTANIARLLVALVIAALLAACSGTVAEKDDEAPAPPGRLTTATFFPTISAAMVRAETTTIDLEANGAGDRIEAHGLMQAGEPDERRLQMTTSIGGDEVSTMVVIGRAAYVRNQSTAGKFHRLDLDHLSDRDAQLFSNLADQRSLDEQFEEFHAAVVKVTRRPASDTTLDGVEVEGYSATVDVGKLRAGAALARQGLDEATYEFWIGADDLPRRMSIELPGSAVVTSYSDWGAPVTIAAPDAADVVVPAQRQG